MSWRNHVEKLTALWPQNISFWPKINILPSSFTISCLIAWKDFQTQVWLPLNSWPNQSPNQPGLTLFMTVETVWILSWNTIKSFTGMKILQSFSSCKGRWEIWLSLVTASSWSQWPEGTARKPFWSTRFPNQSTEGLKIGKCMLKTHYDLCRSAGLSGTPERQLMSTNDTNTLTSDDATR